MKSSNVGMVLISDYFTNALFEDYLKAFGLYDKTGVDFPNELKPYTSSYKDWDGLKKNNMAFGQGVVITPIQMITAFSAVINGGTLYKPYIVEKITDSDGTVVMRNTPTVVRKVISEEVSEKMRSILEDTVDKGTGKRARIEGYAVGGKTGTAQLSAGKSGYIRNEYLSSFIGFFPADKPKYIVMAMFMRPQADIQANKFGGVVAAPVVGNVIRRIIKEEEGFAKNVETNIRDLQSLYGKIVALSELKGVSPLSIIQEGLASTLPSSGVRGRNLTSKTVVNKVADYFNIMPEELCGRSRVSNIKTARQIAMFIMSRDLQMSTPKIALEVGVKDHTTVMHGIKKIETDMKMNFTLRDQIGEIREQLSE